MSRKRQACARVMFSREMPWKAKTPCSSRLMTPTASPASMSVLDGVASPSWSWLTMRQKSFDVRSRTSIPRRCRFMVMLRRLFGRSASKIAASNSASSASEDWRTPGFSAALPMTPCASSASSKGARNGMALPALSGLNRINALRSNRAVASARSP
jgi:hypothetical protein